MNMRVNEIFKSIEGEGARAGYPVTFIRLYGCNLSCSYCDTQYSCVGEEFATMHISDILLKVDELGVPRITITGGEPLMHENIDLLIRCLLNRNYEVNVETNGSIDIYRYVDREEIYQGLMLTMDYKSISSGMNLQMNEKNLRYLFEDDVLKFVVGTQEDLEDMLRIITAYNPNCQVFVSPIFGAIEPVDIVDFIMEKRLFNCKMQLQLHKIIWAPDKRGV